MIGEPRCAHHKTNTAWQPVDTAGKEHMRSAVFERPDRSCRAAFMVRKSRSPGRVGAPSPGKGLLHSCCICTAGGRSRWGGVFISGTGALVRPRKQRWSGENAYHPSGVNWLRKTSLESYWTLPTRRWRYGLGNAGSRKVLPRAQHRT